MTLPAFLLAVADRKCLWSFARTSPAKDQDWTFRRTLTLTILWALTGALLGLALGWAFQKQLVGWTIWLCGLWLGCVALCWFGITALCWNQRAREIRDKGAEKENRKYPRLLRWAMGFIYAALVGLLTPLALVITIENIRGEIAWKRERAHMARLGEHLDFLGVVGPRVPDDQNAGAAPVFAPFFDYSRSTSQDQIVWHSTNQLAALEARLFTPWHYLPDKKGTKKIKTPISMEDWSAAYRTEASKPKGENSAHAALLKLPPPGDPVRDVLAALEVSADDLDAICAAAALPRSQFPLHYREGFDLLLKHASSLKAAQQMLQLRCAAHLAAGNNPSAFQDATNAMNVAELLREEPLLISQLVRYAQGTIALNTIWQGLAQHQWTDEQLATFQQRLSRINYVPGFILAFEGERACGIAGVEHLMRDSNPEEDIGERIGKKVMAGTILRQNQASLARFYQDILTTFRRAAAVSSAGTPVALPELIDHPAVLKLRHFSPYTVMTAILAPAVTKASQRVNRSQITLEMAITACALERYQLANGSFPGTLDELAPKFIQKVPIDPMSGKPLIYRKTDDGWFLLYSVGFDRKDDGGIFTVGSGKTRQEKDWPWPIPGHEGESLF